MHCTMCWRNGATLKLFILLTFFVFVTQAFTPMRSLKHRLNRCSVRMDDEVSRPGIKEELTTRDDYLDSRFKLLSPSGHDLTPMTSDEIFDWMSEKFNKYGLYNKMNPQQPVVVEVPHLGYGQKGLYVCAIGGLPLFSSGSRQNSTTNTLYFLEPCDSTHIRVDKTNNDGKSLVYCVRSGFKIGSAEISNTTNNSKQLLYKVDSSKVRFLPISLQWPVESQPENFWGTEGQYRAWNNHDLISKPLSY